MEESDIVKSGVVYLPVKNFLKTIWVDKFCVLYRRSKIHAYIEVYTNQKAFVEFKTRQKDCDRKIIELRHVLSIKHLSENTIKGSEHRIEIQCKNQKHVLLFIDERDSSEWYSMLNYAVTPNADGSQSSKVEPHREPEFQDIVTANKVYGCIEPAKRFTVSVEPSDLAKLCDIVGKMTMLIGPNSCAFENFATKRVMYTFELAWLRRFGIKKEQFNFEIGRKCPNGEGMIICNSVSAKLIYKIVQDMSNNLSMPKATQVVPNMSSFKEVQDIKQSRLAMTEIDQPDVSIPQLQLRCLETSTTGISGPLPATMFVKKHPYGSKTPNLIPISHIDEDIETSVLSHPITKPIKGVIQTSKELGDKAMVNNSTRSLDSKVQSTLALKKGTISAYNKQNERVKENNEKEEPSDNKKNKEDKKEKEKRLKEKEEWKRLEKEQKQKEKEEKKKSVFSKEKGKQTNENKQRKDSQSYSEVSSEPFTYAECGEMHEKISAEMLPLYATPIKHDKDSPYDEAMSVQRSNEQNKNFNPGLQVKRDALIVSDPVVYTEVSQVKSAWKDSARKDEQHEEDYPNIQKARYEMGETPPLPTRQYCEESDDNDDTYDTTKMKFNYSKQKEIIKNADTNEHIYGIASAKAVNKNLNLSTVSKQEHTGESKSGYSGAEAENVYDGYAAPNEVKSSSLKFAYVPLYEDTDILIKTETSSK